MMKRKMRGVIDPFTLGFLLSFLGAGTVLINEDDKQEDAVADISPAVTVQVANSPTDNEGNQDVE